MKTIVGPSCPPGADSVTGGRQVPVPSRSRFGLSLSVLSISFLLGPLLVSGHRMSLAQDKPPSEYQLKAAFVYNFAKFVEWPPAAFSTPASQFIIGIIGDNPFEDILEQAVQNRKINGHPLRVKQFKALSDLPTCHILFISSSERKRLAEILRSVREANVLTVSEVDHFLSAGGMIQLLMEGNKVRFVINDAAAKEAGLRISAKLLNLAKRPDREAGR